MADLSIILRAKRRIAANHLRHLKRHILLHMTVFSLMLLVLMGSGFFMFKMVFVWLIENLDFIGESLMDNLMGMVFTVFFSMLVFSNLIVTLSTAYTSKEVDFYMALPVERSSIFFVRLVESVFYSSWAFAILSCPLILAYGIARGQPIGFYAWVAALLLPFLIIPAGAGAAITMGLAALFPARKTFKVALLLGALGVLLAIVMLRFMGVQTAMEAATLDNLDRIDSILRFGTAPILPSAWLIRGIKAAGSNDWGEYRYWLALLGVNALMILWLCACTAPWIYYRGWRLAGERFSPRRGGGARKPMAAVDWILSPMRPHLRAMISKDIKTFWRDPAQWSQLMILFGLLFVYVANLRSVASHDLNTALDSPVFKTIISFFNLGAGCFVLSILSTRFVYPMLSLEGRQFWALGLAPMRRETLVWEKYWMCWSVSIVLAGALMLFSNFTLRVGAPMMALSMATVLLMSFALTSLSVGLGAMTPNFNEDNPARIANGMGGTINIFLSLAYVALIIMFEIWPAILMNSGQLDGSRSTWLLLGGSAAAVLSLSALTIVIPMRLGLRRWRELEF